MTRRHEPPIAFSAVGLAFLVALLFGTILPLLVVAAACGLRACHGRPS